MLRFGPNEYCIELLYVDLLSRQHFVNQGAFNVVQIRSGGKQTIDKRKKKQNKRINLDNITEHLN